MTNAIVGGKAHRRRRTGKRSHKKSAKKSLSDLKRKALVRLARAAGVLHPSSRSKRGLLLALKRARGGKRKAGKRRRKSLKRVHKKRVVHRKRHVAKRSHKRVHKRRVAKRSQRARRH